MCPNALSTLLFKSGLLCVLMRFIYYEMRAVMSECVLYDIFKSRACICLNVLYMLLLK